MIWHLYGINCGRCHSHIMMARRKFVNWFLGPKCPLCKSQLGIMEYRYHGEWKGKTEVEALRNYSMNWRKK